MKTPEVINLPVTPAAWNYIRRAVGMCPHDEVHPLIVQLEAEVNAQVAAQNEQANAPQQPMHAPQADMLSGGILPAQAKPNGSGAAAEQETP
ncbi:MAG TPA: hypothetical protein VMS92_06910 [Mycobacterium sp.]|nr:hypothetical protein [Mycobacterium sp.]